MIDTIFEELTSCNICPRSCLINRYETTGFCGADSRIKVNLSQLHYGEEPCLSGSRGSGTIFFSHCNLKCVFCQNHQISHIGWGQDVSAQELVQMMLELQESGAHNINLVTPSHYSLHLIEVIKLAREAGLKIPIVWNSNAYEHVDMLKRLSGLVDVYLPDLKYAHSFYSKKYSFADNYPELARLAVKEMFKQVGNLHIKEDGIATKGLIIRLLVMPNGLAGLSDTLEWISQELGNLVQLSIMAQYYPAYRAMVFPEISRGICKSEYEKVIEKVDYLGFKNVYLQELSCNSEWTPKFSDPSKGE
jgi:putative pyruvate formate lyase activating enzyme